LGRSEKRLPGFYASAGEWSQSELDGQTVIVQDGAGMTSTIACSLHNALDKVLGGRYLKFLENRHARHYYPVAVKRDSRRENGRIGADVRIEAGCVDLAAGLAFGLANVGNCLVLAADAGAGELQLLEFINNTRHFRARAKINIPLNRWLRLEACVAENKIKGTLDGRSALEFTAERPVQGHLGLWCKGDTTAYFKNLEASDAPNDASAP
jgi:pyruvate,water dikinase